MESGYSDEVKEPTETPEPDTETPEPAPIVEEAPKPVQLTADEYQRLMNSASEIDTIKAAQQKMMDTAFGRIGRAIEEMKSSGSPTQVTIDDFPELSAEFPELAAMQVKGLNKVMSKARGAPAADTSALEQEFQRRIAEVREDALDGLNNVIPDWQQEVKTPAFSEWYGKQGEDIKALAASDKVRDAARMLRLFNARPKTPVKSTPTPSPQVAARQKRLEAAVIPRGTGGNTGSGGNSDLDDMLAGYGR
jgi:hypothetical protein